MKTALTTLLLICSLSIHANTFIANNGKEYKVKNCYKECAQELINLGVSSALAIINSYENENIEIQNRVRKWSKVNLLNHHLDNNDLASYDSLYSQIQFKDSSDSEYIEHKRFIKELEIKTSNKENSEAFETAINFIEDNIEIAKSSYEVMSKLKEFVSPTDTNRIKRVLENDKLGYVGSFLTEVYIEQDGDGHELLSLIPESKKSELICHLAENRIFEREEFMSEDCGYTANECREYIQDEIDDVEERFSRYKHIQCEFDMSIDSYIEGFKESALDTILSMEEYEEEENESDECYECKVDIKDEDYIGTQEIVKLNKLTMHITKSWSKDCEDRKDFEIITDSKFYNSQRRASKTLSKKGIKYIDVESLDKNCTLKVEAYSY